MARTIVIGLIAVLMLTGIALGESVTYSDTRVLHGASSGNYYYKVIPEGFTIYLPSESGGILSFKVWNDQGTCYFCNTDNTLYYPDSSLRLNTTSKDINERFTSSIYNVKHEQTGEDNTLSGQGAAVGKIVDITVQSGTSKVTMTTSTPRYNMFMEISDVRFTSGTPKANSSPLTPVSMPALASVATTATPTPSASSSSILEKAGNYKVLFDGETHLLDTVSLTRDTYYVVSYTNLIPFAGGVEVLSSEGKKITSESEVEPVFTSIAWKEASSQLKPSDIETLRGILQLSNDIDGAISPVLRVTGPTVSSINSLKSACISVPIIGKKCAWEAVTAAAPGMDGVATQLEGFNGELNQWKSASSSVSEHLPNAISGIEQARSGGDINPQLQSEISQSLSAFGTLQSKTNQMSQRLSSISSSLSSAESGLREAANNKLVGFLISPVANAVGSMRSEVNTLKGKADSFSRSMGEQSAKLSAVTDTANKRSVELKSMWNARQNAEVRVYGTIVGVIGILVLILAIMFLRKRKEQKIEVKQEVKTEGEQIEEIEIKDEDPVKEEMDAEAEKYFSYGKNALPKLNSEIIELENSLVTMQTELQKTQDLLKRATSRLNNGEISKETFKEMEKRYKDKIQDLKNNVEQAEYRGEKLKEIKDFIQKKKEKR